MTGRYIQSYSVGETFVTASGSLSEEKVVSFALDYDPQAIHTDKTYAENGPFNGIIASGFQTVAYSFRLFLDLGLFVDVSLAGPGMDEIRWVQPVRPDDSLTSHVTVEEARRSRSKPDRGVLRLSFDVRNQHGDTVITYKSTTMIKAEPE